MNAKNLSLKLLFVGLLAAFSVVALKFNGLRQGIDLRGGYSLVFEIRSNEHEIAAAKERLANMEKELEATPPANQEGLKGQIAQQKADLKRYEEADANPADTAEKMIAILKNRVDPQGLLNLEWRPVGRNRIEVRMPAGKPEGVQRRRAYDEALEALAKGNIQRSQMRQALEAPAKDRPALAAKFAGKDEAQAKRLLDLAAANDKVQALQQQIQALQDQRGKRTGPAASQPSDLDVKITALQGQLDNASVDIDVKAAELEKGNISTKQVKGILDQYVPQAEKSSMTRDEFDHRTDVFKAKVQDLLTEFPIRAAEIQKVVDTYKAMAESRQSLDDPSDLKRLISKAGVLEFRIAPFLPNPRNEFTISEGEYRSLVERLQKEGPDAMRAQNSKFLWFPIRGDRDAYDSLVTAEYGGKKYLLLYNQPGYVMLHDSSPAGWSLSSAYVTSDEKGRPAAGFHFNKEGANRFAALTGAHHNHCMAVLLDDEVYSAPSIISTISDSGQITGKFKMEEVQELVRTLEAGSLPAKLNQTPVAESTFGAAFGEENLKQAMKAAWISLLVIGLGMILYYHRSGLIADIAMVLNILFILGAMSALNAVFTLPGIAGIILSIGMAVDSNVLILERLREEQARGLSVRMALKNAYERAWRAILDTHATTIITCVILGWVGTEEVRGFAITLGLGVLFNLFTANTVTRWVCQAMLETGLIREHLGMFKIIGVPKIDWMNKRYYFWGFSLITGVLGVIALFGQGSDIRGIEFSSGTEAVVTFKDDTMLKDETGKMSLLTDGLVRGLLERQAKKDGQDKIAGAAVERLFDANQVNAFLERYAKPGAKQITLADWKAAKKNEEFFRALDKNGDGVLTRDELDKMPSRSYQIATTETKVNTIRAVSREAFGPALEMRTRVEFELAKNTPLPELGAGITAPDTGLLRVTPLLIRQAGPALRESLTDAEGSVILVVRDVKPAISVADFDQRLEAMLRQPDFRAVKPQVLGLKSEEGDTYSAFALLAKPEEGTPVQNASIWENFAKDELNLVQEALHREEAMVATNFDAAIAGSTSQRAIMALILGWVAIILYLWVRFGQARWGLAAVICLVHDVTIMVGLVAISGWLYKNMPALSNALLIEPFKIDLAMITALLTIIGYSVNDTIVVFDRIRENRGKLVHLSEHVINSSINQTLSRTILTSVTVFAVCFVMYVWGGRGIHAFNYAMLAGVFFGTYSSIAVAAPILLGFKGAVIRHFADREYADEIAAAAPTQQQQPKL